MLHEPETPDWKKRRGLSQHQVNARREAAHIRASRFELVKMAGDEVLRMLVTGGPPVRGGGGMPQRIIVSSRSAPTLRTTGAG